MVAPSSCFITLCIPAPISHHFLPTRYILYVNLYA